MLRPCRSTPPPLPQARRRASSRLALLPLAALTAITLSGCAPAVNVDVAPSAADPVCASVVLALPETLADSPLLDTTSQATAAWGSPTTPIVLRCGVQPLPPTTDHCVTATDSAGTNVDWVAVEGPANPDGGAPWTFTTYGREPAIEVTVPPEVTKARSTAFLVDLGPAVAHTKKLRSCV